ncbi:outer membrane beta-barrel family protein [Pedobacter metabolipauper]|uniref:Outer membrane receptor protein involved in Fe transport n=1 Tax=Pedobacter metabolipauper TaxID=425513 RepID=A0A4R6T392_9SPHI|nr:outer membrane beta-barrel family protein [Pedobacter metabolipauper]TDQ11841.1 outer membrane receptor protein involved in Fe transport [Pedobacter metabolipauper]
MKKLDFTSFAFLFLLNFAGLAAVNAQDKKLIDTLKKDTLSDGKLLKEVSINVRKKMIERKIDRTVIHVAGFATAAGTDAMDLLGRLPGLRVTDDGNVNLMGKGATIFVDGKPTYLSGADLAAYLKSLPTDLLDKIELMPNPPAKYDAAGSGGIINIITKKNKQPGYNVSVSGNAGSGVYRKVNGSLNMNYRVGKLNLFVNAGAGSPKDFENSSAIRRFLNPDGSAAAILNQESEIAYTRNNGNAKLGADYYLNKKTTVGIILNAARNSVVERGDNRNLMLNSLYLPDSSIFSANDANNKLRNNLLNLNMVHQFDSLGTEISIDLDYGKYHTQIDQIFSNHTYSPQDVLLSNERIRGALPRNIKIYSAKTDFTLPLKNDITISTGIKMSKVSTDNMANYFTGEGDAERPDYNRTNSFLYDETIGAAYLEGFKAFGRFGVKAGLRAEQTHADGHQYGNAMVADSSFSRSYLNAFPTLFISFKPDAKNINQFFFNYGRRIGRPGYDKLNPFLSLVQRYNQVAGNPFLKPDFTHTFEFTHVFKEQLNTVLYYSDLSNISSQVIRPMADIYVKRPENTGDLQIMGAMITYNRDLFKWWNADFSVNPERIHMNVLLDGKRVDTAYFAHSFNWFNRFNISKSCTAEMVMNWGGRSFSGQNTTRGIAAFRAGIKQQLFNGNGSIGLSGSDLFYTAITRGKIVNVAGSDASYENRKDSRSVMLSFSYRISRNAKENKRLRDRNGARDEQDRVLTN